MPYSTGTILLHWRWASAFKTAPIDSWFAAAPARCRFAAVPFVAASCRSVAFAAWPTGEENNGQYDAIYYRYFALLSAGTYLMVLYSAARNGSKSGAVYRYLGAALGCGNGAAYSPSRWRPTFTKANILPEWHAFLGVGFAVFLAA